MTTCSGCLQTKRKMKACDSEALPKVERMSLLALCAGVEAEGVAAGLSGQSDKPLQHRLAMALRTRRRVGDQIIDVERLPARQNVLYAKACNRNNGVFMLQKRELIPLDLLSLDASEKLFLDQQWPKLAHHRKAASDLLGCGSDLEGPHASMPLPVFPGAQMRDVRDMMTRVPRIKER